MDEAGLRVHLAGLPIPDLRWFASVGSTNLEALQWASAGAPDGALVTADQQSAGRGRLGRKWVTNPGAALAFSLVVRPSGVEKDAAGLFSPLAGLGVTFALDRLGLAPEIKWPNDVLLGRRKTCGILAESVWVGEDLQALVLGIGVNVAPSSVPPPEEVLFPATCVEAEAGRSIDRLELLAAILREIFAWRLRLNSAEFILAWQKRLAFRGEEVTVQRPGQAPLSGELVGIDPQGGLRLRDSSGIEMNILAGDVSLRPHQQ